MPQARWRLLPLLAAALAGPAAAAGPLLLGVLRGGDDPPLLRPALSLQDGQWTGLDNKLGESARATGLPDFARSNKAAPAAATPQQLGHVLSAAAADLRQWQGRDGAGRPLMRKAVAAREMQWSCERSWGLQLDRPAGGAGDFVLLANRALELRAFGAIAAVDAADPAWRAATPEQQGAAVDFYLSTAAPRPGAADAAALKTQLAAATAQTVRTSRVTLGDGRQLVAVVQQRQAGAPEDSCAAPVLVDSAFFRIGRDGRPQRVASQSEVQDCADGWQPGAREEPWMWLEAEGQPYLLQWNYGVEARRLGVYKVDARTLAPGEFALASGGESGC
ncbi:hypothetical protein [Tahibacter harae]|uniref:Lipoprotein n=1 Tax=Tahibacter harae TaxID=2963937 RepID=A0ABT1QWV4_9GAMM|nr:hypothetical protein [Tahibacter harae]MCQ4166770.1 hypothetical protein [Tahibacter harae]